MGLNRSGVYESDRVLNWAVLRTFELCWIVLEGLAHATVEGVSIDLEPGHVINIAPHSQSRLKNFGLNKLRVLSTSMEIVKKAYPFIETVEEGFPFELRSTLSGSFTGKSFLGIGLGFPFSS